MPNTQATNTEVSIEHSQLTESMLRHTQGENFINTPIDGFALHRWDQSTSPTSYSLKPSICLISQGSKQVILGDETYVYDANHFLISSVDLPVVANIIDATPDKPYLGLILELDLKEISQLVVESELFFSNNKQTQSGMAVGELTPEILNAFQRLVNLSDDPDSIAILAPMIKREIFYRLLKTPQGQLLYQIATAGSHSHQISKAIDWLNSHFSQPLSVNELAQYSGMSKSAFHAHFRSITSMTPLQFQKKLRLNEARRLMLAENLDASETTYKVGYESPSQFSREYSRFFGLPPKRDIEVLRNQTLLN